VTNSISDGLGRVELEGKVCVEEFISEEDESKEVSLSLE
jgi:hypothetical protein